MYVKLEFVVGSVEIGFKRGTKYRGSFVCSYNFPTG